MSEEQKPTTDNVEEKAVAKGDAHDEVQEYPHGLKESPGGKVPLFLKLTYTGFIIFAIVYGVLYISGDGSPLVELLNQATAK